MASSGPGVEKETSLQPAGQLLGNAGLLTLLGGLVLAAWFGQMVIAVLLGLALAAAGLTRLWSRFALVRVECQRTLSESRAFPGESIEVRLKVQNRKLLPLPWIQVDDEIPARFAPDLKMPPAPRPGYGLFSKGAVLPWYTGVSWKQTLCCDKRGYYRLGPITITSGDIFGFYPRSVSYKAFDYLIVYPRLFPITRLALPTLFPAGEAREERRIFEDPTRILGVRDYTPRDSPRRIHWKASARRQGLQVKVFDATTTLNVAIFLAVDTFSRMGTEGEEEYELGISTAASLAAWAVENGNPAGMYVNARMADTGQPVKIPPGGSPAQLAAILEALAKVTYTPSGPFEELLERERSALPWGATMLFVLGRPSPELAATIENLKEKRRRVAVFQVGNGAAAEGGPSWQHIGAAEAQAS